MSISTATCLRALAIAGMLMLANCAPAPQGTSAAPIAKISSIKIDGVQYKTTAEALAALRGINEKVLDTFAKTPEPIKGRARVIVPDRDRLRPLVAQELLQRLKRPATGEFLDYEVASRQLGLRGLADALARTGTFESVDVVEQNDVRNPEIGDMDYLVWYQVRTTLPDFTGPWVGHWLVRRSGSTATGSAGIDPGTRGGAARYISFINSVREATQRLNGTALTASGLPRTAATPSAPGAGSGFIVDDRGAIVTNEHVVRVCPDPHVTDGARRTYDATIVAMDAANDLALLKATHHWSNIAAFRDSHEARPGDAVVVTGYPLSGLVGSGVAVTTGSITMLTGPRDDSRLLQISAPLQPGNSGGPVLDASGHVVGVATGTLNGMVLAILTGVLPQNVNFAVKANVVRNFLETHEIAYTHVAGAQELQASDVGDLARKFTVHVDCRKRDEMHATPAAKR